MDSRNSANKIKVYDGSTDVQIFLQKVTIEASLKGREGEKFAQHIASKLDGPAFDVYRRLSTDDKKDPDKIIEELTKEFERGKAESRRSYHLLARSTTEAGRVATNICLQAFRTRKISISDFC